MKTFNGAKIANGLREARNWRAEGTVQQATGPREVNTAASLTLREGLETLLRDEAYAPWTVQLDGYLWKALTKADSQLPGVKLKELTTARLRVARCRRSRRRRAADGDARAVLCSRPAPVARRAAAW